MYKEYTVSALVELLTTKYHCKFRDLKEKQYIVAAHKMPADIIAIKIQQTSLLPDARSICINNRYVLSSLVPRIDEWLVANYSLETTPCRSKDLTNDHIVIPYLLCNTLLSTKRLTVSNAFIINDTIFVYPENIEDFEKEIRTEIYFRDTILDKNSVVLVTTQFQTYITTQYAFEHHFVTRTANADIAKEWVTYRNVPSNEIKEMGIFIPQAHDDLINGSVLSISAKLGFNYRKSAGDVLKVPKTYIKSIPYSKVIPCDIIPNKGFADRYNLVVGGWNSKAFEFQPPREDIVSKLNQKCNSEYICKMVAEINKRRKPRGYNQY